MPGFVYESWEGLILLSGFALQMWGALVTSPPSLPVGDSVPRGLWTSPHAC